MQSLQTKQLIHLTKCYFATFKSRFHEVYKAWLIRETTNCIVRKKKLEPWPIMDKVSTSQPRDCGFERT